MSEHLSAEAHYKNLFRFAVSLTRRESDANDLVQQTYLKWMKNREQIKDQRKVRSWLFTTLYREFLRDTRRGKRIEYVDEGALEGNAAAAEPDTGRALDAQFAMEALQRVPEPYRATIALFYVEDCTYLEIAEVLGIAPGTVMSRIYRGKQILKGIVDAGAASPPRPRSRVRAREAIP